jgi:hypothetical protein
VALPRDAWAAVQQQEATWWGDCRNTFEEERKQTAYAARMGIPLITDAIYPSYDGRGKRIVDIGGGPVSLLLKTFGAASGTVVDPGHYPSWVLHRYHEVGIEYVSAPGEDWEAPGKFDEAWIYNVLEHTMDPEQIIKNAFASAPVLRLFEWVDPIPDEHHAALHPTHLTAGDLDWWTGGKGKMESLKLNETNNELPGTAYYGVFYREVGR